jgi:uncharacterized protein (TIGR02466 family)
MGETFSTTYRLGPAITVPSLQYYDLFPTRIWQVRLEVLQPYLAAWTTWVLALRAANPAPAGRTNRGGWNSKDMALLEQPTLAPLRQIVHSACATALGEMGRGGQPFVLQSWVNLHDRGGFNFLHMHEASLLSGSFYLKVPAGSGALCFRDPRPGVIHGSVKGSFPNAHADVNLKPSTGLLVLFPSWMEHYVEPHESDEPRICIAFNANE